MNGYFTVTEFPVLEAIAARHVLTATDLDMLAYRFPHAGHSTAGSQARRMVGGAGLAIDPVLGCPVDRADMIVGEVKEGTPRLNRAMRDPAVLATALMRFGCCPAEQSDALTGTHREVARGTPGGASHPRGWDMNICACAEAQRTAAPPTSTLLLPRAPTMVPVRRPSALVAGSQPGPARDERAARAGAAASATRR